MEKNVAVIGATGNMGSQISKGLVKAGYIVTMYARDDEKLHALEHEINSDNALVAHSLEEAVEDSDIVFIAVHHLGAMEVAENLKDLVAGKIVVNISNPLNADYSALSTGWEKSAAEQMQNLLTNATVVKAFNTIFAARINNAEVNGVQIDHFIAGDDEASVAAVSELVKTLGHNPIYAGKLDESRMLEHMAFLNISLSMKGVFQWNSAWKLMA